MNVTITVPTIGRIDSVTKSMLASLSNQSFTDSKVYFIVPRYYQEENLLSILEETELDFKIVHQDREGFENAMNTAIKMAKNQRICHLMSGAAIRRRSMKKAKGSRRAR